MLLLPWFALSATAEEVAVIANRLEGPYAEALNGFRQASTYTPVVYEFRGSLEQARTLISDLPKNRFAAVLALGSDASQAADALPPETAVVYTMVAEPMDLPGRHSGGVLIKLGIKEQLAAISELLPTKKRIGIIYCFASSGKDIVLARSLAPSFGLTLMPIAVESDREVPNALKNFTPGTIDLQLLVVDSVTLKLTALLPILKHCAQEGLPLIGLSPQQVKAGATLALCCDYTDVGAQSAELLTKVLRSENALPPDNPRKLIVYVNRTAQKQLGLGDLATTRHTLRDVN